MREVRQHVIFRGSLLFAESVTRTAPKNKADYAMEMKMPLAPLKSKPPLGHLPQNNVQANFTRRKMVPCNKTVIYLTEITSSDLIRAPNKGGTAAPLIQEVMCVQALCAQTRQARAHAIAQNYLQESNQQAVYLRLPYKSLCATLVKGSELGEVGWLVGVSLGARPLIGSGRDVWCTTGHAPLFLRCWLSICLHHWAL
jgi:hypothetical protein